MTPTEIPIESLCRRLHLANAPRIYQALAERAEREQWSYLDFLSTLFAEEVAHRTQTRLSRLTHKAGFPFFKTIDDFDFTFQSTLRLAMLGSYLSPDFVTEGRTLILNGKSSRGKTHLAIAIAYRAIQNGFEALFTTAAALIEDLSRASAERRLRDALVAYTHPHVLVVDEVGYLSYGPDAANVLYHVVNARHLRRRAMVFTTNKSLRSWGKVLHDQDLADAIVERILERGRLITLDGPSMRTRHLELGDMEPEDALQPAIISGIDRPEFPEPTASPTAGRSSSEMWSIEPSSNEIRYRCIDHLQLFAVQSLLYGLRGVGISRRGDDLTGSSRAALLKSSSVRLVRTVDRTSKRITRRRAAARSPRVAAAPTA